MMPKASNQSTAKDVQKVNLALQGGGAHGAFTWGVLHRILDEEDIEFDGISATSAGAMNGTLLSYGLAVGGRKEAQRILEAFWKKVSQVASLSPMQPSIIDKMMGNNDMALSPSFMAMEYMTRVFSPYQLNIFDLNPFRDFLEEMIDFEVVRKHSDIKLFVNATNVLTGKIKVFEHTELTLDMLLASACLPFLFKTVEVDGQPYWDGGYSGNPAIFPLIYHCDCKDVLIVQVNPIQIEEVPKTAHDILDRVNEISFNSTLMREARAIAFVSKLLDQGMVDDTRYKDMRLHLVESEDIMAGLGHASKFNADWDFLKHLKEAGIQAADDWIASHKGALGKESSLDIESYFL